MQNYPRVSLLLRGCNRPYNGVVWLHNGGGNQEEYSEIFEQNSGYAGTPNNLHNLNLVYEVQQTRSHSHTVTPCNYSQSPGSRHHLTPTPPAPLAPPIPPCPKTPRLKHSQIPVKSLIARSGRKDLRANRVEKCNSDISHGQHSAVSLGKRNVDKLMNVLV